MGVPAAISLAQGSRGLLLDPTNGLSDFGLRELRTVSTHTLMDDPSRVLKLMTLQARLGFQLDERTKGQYQRAREAKIETSISAEALRRELVKIGAIVRAGRRAKELVINDSLIFDDEINGKHNIDAFMDLWKVRNAYQPLTNSIGIKWNVKEVILRSENDEPLLQLPDYVAGIAHFIHSKSNTLSASQVSEAVARKAHSRLSNSSKFVETSREFDLDFATIVPVLLPYVVRG